ncbi:MAG: queuosine precursor transporter [Bdellovibrionales bacterium]
MKDRLASENRSRDMIYLILSGIFIANALLAEIIGSKLFNIWHFNLSLGVIIWPVVFITTDLINEYFGRRGVRNLSIFTALLVLYAFVVFSIGMRIPAVSFSPVQDAPFKAVFGQSQWIIAGSITAFLISQLVDVVVFWVIRAQTKGKYLWLRATGSTVISQLVDTFIVGGIGLYLPGVLGLLPEGQVAMTFGDFMSTCLSGYTFKLLVAVAMTPVIYLGHSIIDRALGDKTAHDLIESAARASLK